MVDWPLKMNYLPTILPTCLPTDPATYLPIYTLTYLLTHPPAYLPTYLAPSLPPPFVDLPSSHFSVFGILPAVQSFEFLFGATIIYIF